VIGANLSAFVNSRQQKRTALSILCAMMLATSCAESPTETAGGPGYYRLVSANGASVPSAAGASRILSGDLVLRTNGTAQYAVRGSFPAAFGPPTFSGQYTVSGDQITLASEGTTNATGTLGGDSLLLSIASIVPGPAGPMISRINTVFWRMQADDVPVKSGTYVMTHDGTRPINGVIGTESTTQYDTIRFFDGVFYQRSVAFGSLTASSTSRYPGTYRGNSVSMLLYQLADESLTNTAPHTDSLFVKDGAIIRRIWGIDGVLDQRYEQR
jgi:hypothetical protein